MSWSRPFDDPIQLPDGGQLVTRRDAGEHIQALSKAEQQRPEWQLAAEMLLNAAERGGIVMFAEIAMRRALNAGGGRRRSHGASARRNTAPLEER